MKHCDRHASDYLHIPMSPLNKVEVFADNETLIHTNSRFGEGELESFYELVSCKELSGVEYITINFTSYLGYYANFKKYPFVSPKKIGWADSIHFITLVSLGLCLLALVILPLVNRVSSQRSIALRYTVQSLIFVALVQMYLPIEFLKPSFGVMHALNMITVSLGILLFAANILRISSCYTWLLFVGTLALSILFAISGKNSLHLLFVALGIPDLLILTYIFIYKFKSKSILKKILYFVTLLLTGIEVYYFIILHEGVFIVPSIVILMTLISMIEVFEDGLFKIKMAQILETEIDTEKEFNAKLTSYQERYLGILHDLKAPITSLGFLLKKETPNVDLLSKVSNRLGLILKEISDDALMKAPDWYNISIFIKELDYVLEEKRELYKDISLKLVCKSDDYIQMNLESLEAKKYILQKLQSLFFNPHEFYLICSELIDNGYKYSKDKHISIELVLSGEDSVKLNVSNNILSANYSRDSSRKGLKLVTHKMKSFGGRAIGNYSNEKINIQLSFRARNTNATST